jgi:hypothetical protein
MYYPTTLPNPVVSKHSEKARVSNPSLPGLSAYLARERDYSGSVDVEFFLDATQAAAWYAWWETDLLEGGQWFNVNWPALRPGFMVVQFVTEPVFTHVYNGAHRVSATVQVRGATQAVTGGICALGPTWSASTLLTDRSQLSVAYGNGRFVIGAVTSPGGLAVAQWSTNGVTWNASASALSAAGIGLKNVLFANGIFFSDINAIQSATSTDGDTWTLQSHVSQVSSFGFAAAGRFYLCEVSSANFLYTIDGVSYSYGSFSGVNRGNYHGAYGNGIYVAIGPSGGCRSIDGLSWTNSTLPGVVATRVAFGAGVFVAIGDSSGASTAATKYSADGTNWTAGALPSSVVWSDIVYAQGVFLVSATATNDIAISSNGITWVMATEAHKFTTALTNSNRLATTGTGAYVAIKLGVTTLANVGAC